MRLASEAAVGIEAAEDVAGVVDLEEEITEAMVALHREAALEAETEPFPMAGPRTVAESMAVEAVEDKDGGNSSFQSAMLPFVAGHSAFFFFFALPTTHRNTK